MKKLSKKKREELATWLFDKCLETGLNLEMNGQWVVVSPASKVTVEITLAMSECGDELAELVKKAEQDCKSL